MKFYKYQGAGNDFILINNLQGKIEESQKAELAKRYCKRHFSIGADGIMILENSDEYDAKMRFFNPDGSEGEMCGNAIRCFARHIYERGIKKKKELNIDTQAGVKRNWLTVENGEVKNVKVDMGKPLIKNQNLILDVKGIPMKMFSLEVGVPHAVLIVNDLARLKVNEIGKEIRNNPIFPKGTNVNFLQQIGKNRFKIRTYERGVERETMACGSGSCASGSSAVLLGLADADKPIEIEAEGGKILVEITKIGEELETIFMSGPSEFIYEGEI
jgi:diaminopimelate epimerase